MIIKLCTLTRLQRKADKSVSLAFTTMQEQSTKEFSDLDEFFQQDCIIAVKPLENQFNDSELRDLDAIDLDIYDKPKSKAQRLRNTLFMVLKSELGRKPTDEEFKDFYSSKMEIVINHFKEKING